MTIDTSPTGDGLQRKSRAFEQKTLLQYLFVVSFFNGIYSRVVLDIQKEGIVSAAFGTFGISAVIWISAIFIFQSLHQLHGAQTRSPPVPVLCICTLLVMFPVSGMAWLSISLLGLYLAISEKHDEKAARIGLLMLALSFSAQWSKFVFRFFLDQILSVDAFLVAFITGAPHDSNLIRAADGVTLIQVLEGCSSFNNLSLAFLGWFLARTYYGTRGLLRSFGFLVLSCVLVIFINTIRIGIIVISPSAYDIAHGPIGANIANLATTFAILSISYYGARKN